MFFPRFRLICLTGKSPKAKQSDPTEVKASTTPRREGGLNEGLNS